MHWIISLILYDLLGLGEMSDVVFIGAAVVFGLLIFGVGHYILFSLAVVFLLRRSHNHFEYSLRRDWMKGIVHCFIGTLISAEIVGCYFQGLMETYRYFIPLWIVFIVVCVWAIMRARPFRQRSMRLRKLNKAAK